MRQRRAAAEPGNSYQYVLLAALRVLVALYREAQPRCFQAEAHKNVPDRGGPDQAPNAALAFQIG